MRYISYYDSGEILCVASGPEVPPPSVTDVALYHLAHETAEPDTHRVDLTGEPVAVAYSPEGVSRKRSPPGPGRHWDPATEQWIDDRAISEVRGDLLERLRVKRDALIESGFTWDGSTFDSDAAISQPRLLGLFTSAISGAYPPEGYPWRLADNSWRVLSAADAQSVWATFQSHMAGMFQAFAAHEFAVLSESDVEVLQGYDIDANWT